MPHSAYRAWSKIPLTSLMVPMMNILTSSPGKPIALASASEKFRPLRSDNCRIGLYCDAIQKVCIQRKDIGTQCDADKE